MTRPCEIPAPESVLGVVDTSTRRRDEPADERARWRLIALNLSGLPRAVVCAFARDRERWLDRPPRVLEEDRALPATAAQRSVAARALERAGETAGDELERARGIGARVVTLVDEGYPPPLLDLPLPPPVLYLRGTTPARPALAIVGSRKASAYALEVAALFAEELARHGVWVVSGLARGVDGAAHRGALEAPGGRTAGVLGCGVDVEYPRRRENLHERIAERGALLSEFPLGTRPRPQNFPIRNRIIAALASTVLVAEGTARSGSLITARLALDLGRDVAAVPGRIFEPGAQGPNALIRDGALPALHPSDLLDTLPLPDRELLAPGPSDPAAAPPPGDTGRLLAALAEAPSTPEQLAAATSLPIEEVLARLLDLELAGHIRRHPGALWALSPRHALANVRR